MRTIAHISDLHFGATDDTIVAGLRDALLRAQVDVVAVSGDLTQRARRGQFLAARHFLASLPFPQVVVPGNHDVPLYNVLFRFAQPLWGYTRYITRDRHPRFVDEAVALLGADTTRAFTIKDGGLTRADVRQLVAALDALPADVLKVIVCHHPFDPLTRGAGRLTRPLPDAAAVETLVAHGADLFLTGHLHVSYAGQSSVRYNVAGRAAVIVQAGTATSTRARGEANSFNLVLVEREAVVVERMAWVPADRTFAPVQRERFRRCDEGWAVCDTGITTASQSAPASS